MIIGVTGYGFSGASACMDLIKEFDGVQFYDPHVEFQLLQQPDGIRDLRFNLVESHRRLSINSAICRFIQLYNYSGTDKLSVHTNGQFKKLSEEYIASLSQITWKGKSIFDTKDIASPLEDAKYRWLRAILRRLLRLSNKDSTWPPNRTRYYSCITEEEFDAITARYLNSILIASGFKSSSPVLLEQLFCLEHPTEGGEYFDDFRSIIVDRDPRDVYVMTNGGVPGRPPGFMPNDGNVQSFIEYYRDLHRTRDDDSRVLYLNFEDLIFDYDKTVKRLSNFLGLRHVNPKKWFKPEWSINNTRIYERCTNMTNDIQQIETALPELLYPFARYSEQLGFIPESIDVFNYYPGDMS